MSTKNIVPRADGEGSLGTTAKRWGDVQTKKLTSQGAVSAGSVTAGDITATGEISGTTAEFTGAVSAGSVMAGGVDVANLLASGAAAHNAIFRGKYLGSSVTAEQWAAIKAGTFDDLYTDLCLTPSVLRTFLVAEFLERSILSVLIFKKILQKNLFNLSRSFLATTQSLII